MPAAMVRLARCALCVLLCLSAIACFPDATGDPPSLERSYFYYPVALGLSEPSHDYLLVVSSNFDLLYNSGSIVPVDLSKVRATISACRGEGEFGCAEFVVPTERDMKDERFGLLDYLLEDHAVRIASYAGLMATMPGLALVPVRADASLTMVEVDEVPADELGTRRVLRCSSEQEPGSVPRCSSAYRIDSGMVHREGDQVELAPEPYSVVHWQDEPTGIDFAVVGHMLGGEVSLLRIDPVQPTHSELIDVDDSFPEGTAGLAVDDRDDDLGDRFIATSRFQGVLTAFHINVTERSTGTDLLTLASVAPEKTIEVTPTDPANEQLGIVFSPDGTRAFIVSRKPESVLVLDTTPDGEGGHADRFVDVIEVGFGPSLVRVHEDPDSPGEYLLYVVCFDADRIFVIEPQAREVVDVIATRRGPHDLVFDDEARVAYLANFLESTISVIDVDPSRATYHTILTTLGKPRRPRTND